MPTTTDDYQLKADLSNILHKFLTEISYEFPTLDLNPAVEDNAQAHFRNNGFSDEYISKIEGQIKTSVGIATMAFQKTPFDIQCVVAIFTTYALIIDDFANESHFKRDLKGLYICLLTRKPQENKVLQCLTDFLRTLYDKFGQFSSDMVVKDTLQFISACYVEADGEKNLQFPAEADQYAYYFRLKSGFAEAYSFLLYPLSQFSEVEILRDCLPTIPYLVAAFNWINDIMSFYKEAMEDDNCNFIGNSAKCHGLTPVEFLQRLCGDTCETIRVLRVLGKAHPRLSETLDAFVPGYVLYHLSQKRYRLDELQLPAAHEARQKVKALKLRSDVLRNHTPGV